MKQVQRKKALETKDEEADFEVGQRASDPLRLKSRKMTEDEKKVRFMIDQIDNQENKDNANSPFK